MAQPESTPGARYRVVRVVDIFPDEASTPEDAARIAYEQLIAADIQGELPILEVTDIESGVTVDVDLQDQIEALEGYGAPA